MGDFLRALVSALWKCFLVLLWGCLEIVLAVLKSLNEAIKNKVKSKNH